MWQWLVYYVNVFVPVVCLFYQNVICVDLCGLCLPQQGYRIQLLGHASLGQNLLIPVTRWSRKRWLAERTCSLTWTPYCEWDKGLFLVDLDLKNLHTHTRTRARINIWVGNELRTVCMKAELLSFDHQVPFVLILCWTVCIMPERVCILIYIITGVCCIHIFERMVLIIMSNVFSSL
jgi:hypothetical protein